MNKRISIVEGDITAQKVDAIVNAANSSLLGGGGVDGAIHRAAGPNLLDECRTLHGCRTGEAKATKGYNLHAVWVIHTVGPIWGGGTNGEEKLLSRCYVNSLTVATNLKAKSIAFPSISTGAYGFPIERASKIALRAIEAYLSGATLPGKVIIVCFSHHDFLITMNASKELQLVRT